MRHFKTILLSNNEIINICKIINQRLNILSGKNGNFNSK